MQTLALLTSKAFPVIVPSTALIVVDSRRGSHLGQGGVRAVTDMSSMRVRTGPITLNGMMSVGAESNQFPSSYVSTTTDEGRGKAHEVSLAGAAESNPEK